jgi:hypothetical protein
MNTTMKTLFALTMAAATLTVSGLAGGSACAQGHDLATVSVLGSIPPGSTRGRLSPINGVGLAPVIGKPRSSTGQWHCIPGLFGNCGFGPHRHSAVARIGMAPVVGKPRL